MLNKRTKIIVYVTGAISLLLLGVNFARTNPNITSNWPVEYRRIYAKIFPIKFMKVHISDKQYRAAGISQKEMDWIIARGRENRQWHDRQVHFGNLQYCNDYIVYQDSNPLPATYLSHSTTYYIVRQNLEAYCFRAHMSSTRDKACPPVELDCSTSCLTLTCAILNKQPKMIKKLVEDGANVNQKLWDDAHFSHSTVLHGAVGMGDAALVKFLIEHGADLEVKDYRGYAPLFYAVQKMRNSDPEIIKLLLEAGAKTKMKENGQAVSFLDFVKVKANKRISKEIREEIIRIAEKYE